MASPINDSPPIPKTSSHVIYDDLPLDVSNKEIRLLEISPGDGAEPLTCKLFCETLSADVEYIALSYTWELSAPLHDVKINGLEFPLRQTLYATLLQIRRSSSPVRLWADAVCINQASIPERNSQVPLMREIYSAASKVLIWLGEGNDATDHAIAALHKLVMLRHDSDWVLDDLHMLLPEDMKLSEYPPGKRNEKMKSIKAGMNDIFTRPWFNRTWTVQELALAQDTPLLLCGSSSICWECFRTTNAELDKYLSATPIRDENSEYWALSGVQSAISSRKCYALSEIRLVAQAAKQLQGESINSYLARILSSTQHTLCTDPKDKVYGLLGIAEPDALAAIQVDYTRSLLEVYAATTTYLMMEGGFQVLSLQGVWPLREGWPSWVVDFRRSLPENYMPLIKGYDDRTSKYYTLPYIGEQTQTLARFLPGMVFRVNGIPIDKVVETSRTWRSGKPHGPLGKYDLQLSGDVFRLFSKAARPCVDCASKEQCLHPTYSPRSRGRISAMGDAVLRTLVGDWIDPTRRYDARPTGPTSDKHFGILRRVLRSVVDDTGPLAAIGIGGEENESITNAEWRTLASLASERLLKGLNGRVAFRTEHGWIGTGSYDTRPGDYVVAVVGADVPFIIRHTDDGVTLVGECYVDGIMFGELLEDPYCRPGGDMGQPIQLCPFDIH